MNTWHSIIKYAAIALAVLIIIGVISGIMFVLSHFVPGFANNAVGEDKTYEIKDEISVLDIDIHAINLEVRTTTDSTIRVESNYKYLTVTEKDNRLLIKDKKAFFLNYQGKAIIRLYIPDDKLFDTIEINTGAGKADLKNLQTKFIYMNFGAGKVDLRNISARVNASLETGAGQLTIRNSTFNNLNLNMGVGQFEFSGKLTGRNILKMGVGSSQIDLSGSLDDYTVKIEKGIGEIRVNNKKVQSDTQLGQGDIELFFEGGVGSAWINFSE